MVKEDHSSLRTYISKGWSNPHSLLKSALENLCTYRSKVHRRCQSTSEKCQPSHGTVSERAWKPQEQQKSPLLKTISLPTHLNPSHWTIPNVTLCTHSRPESRNTSSGPASTPNSITAAKSFSQAKPAFPNPASAK